jgi:hypothetical protein
MAAIVSNYSQQQDNDNDSVSSDESESPLITWMERFGDSSLYDEFESAVWHNNTWYNQVEFDDNRAADMTESETFLADDGTCITVLRTWGRRENGDLYVMSENWRFHEDDGFENAQQDGVEINVQIAEGDSMFPEGLIRVND